MAQRSREIRRQRHAVGDRRYDAARDAPVDMLRRTVRDRPVVDDQRRGCRAELDDTAVSDHIVLSRQIEIWVDDPSVDHERNTELHAGACDQRFGGLGADVQGQYRIAGLGVAVHPCPGIGQAADRADLGLPGVEQVTELSAREEGVSVRVSSDDVDHAGARVAKVLPAECGEPLCEEARVNPSTVNAELIGVHVRGAGIVEKPRFGIGIIECTAHESVVADAILGSDGSADAIEIEAVDRSTSRPNVCVYAFWAVCLSNISLRGTKRPRLELRWRSTSAVTLEVALQTICFNEDTQTTGRRAIARPSLPWS